MGFALALLAAALISTSLVLWWRMMQEVTLEGRD